MSALRVSFERSWLKLGSTSKTSDSRLFSDLSSPLARRLSTS
jgi:hypothetical protein